MFIAACGSPTQAPQAAQATPTAVPAAPATATSAPTGEQPLAARVNGQPIYLSTYQKQVAQYEKAFAAQGFDLNSDEGKAMMQQVRRQVLEGLIDQVLIEQAAAKMGITVSDEELDAKIKESIKAGGGQQSFEEWLKLNDLTFDEFREMMRSQLISEKVFEKVVPPPPATVEQVHARHILVKTEEEARQVLERLKKGEDFAQLARELSTDPTTKDKGGDLGFFPRGLSFMPPEVEEAAFSLEPGQISGVVKSYFGYHIIQVLEKDPAHPLSPEMQRAYKEQQFRQWLEQERSKATIERFIE